MKYCESPFEYKRLFTHEVNVGSIGIGGKNPIRVQSMTNTDTDDINATVEQTMQLADAGCEIVRVTVPNLKTAENLETIVNTLRQKNYTVPLVADIHFTPNAAMKAVEFVEKIRINPGNYVDKKKFAVLEYTDAEYLEELYRIEDKFTPLVEKAKKYNRALRIGTNHGSLSDRIMNRYGDTPHGMVESAWEFAAICMKNGFHNFLFSMKASNPQVMIQAYRLLQQKMYEENALYPLHLGVTEAGDGEDGRVKSFAGIGTLLDDGLGDTIRVSLTESPLKEIPIAKALADKYNKLRSVEPRFILDENRNPYQYKKRETIELSGVTIGGYQLPQVVLELPKPLSALSETECRSFKLIDIKTGVEADKYCVRIETENDLLRLKEFLRDGFFKPDKLIVSVSNQKLEELLPKEISSIKRTLKPDEPLPVISDRTLILELDTEKIDIEPFSNWIMPIELPDSVILMLKHGSIPFYRVLATQFPAHPILIQSGERLFNADAFQMELSIAAGSLLCDGIGDGVWLNSAVDVLHQIKTAFNVLQATRVRVTKTEFISCPSCGRTLFDLEETTARIKERTSHLRGVKIAIMGCIVNGPGEMADADFGYVGAGPGKINLYVGKDVVKRNIQTEFAVDELVTLIQEHDMWLEPESV